MKSSFKLSQSFLIAVSALYSSATFAYTIETVKSEEIGKSVAIGGTVIPYKEVTLAAQVPGRVQYILGE
jgi:multidrug efflux pump subunit AcrA (membrane-fusion protein)